MVGFSSADDAQQKGYRPCKVCKPRFYGYRETETPEIAEGEGSRHEVRYLKKDNFDNSNLKLFNEAAGTYYSWLFIKTAEGLGLDQVKA